MDEKTFYTHLIKLQTSKFRLPPHLYLYFPHKHTKRHNRNQMFSSGWLVCVHLRSTSIADRLLSEFVFPLTALSCSGGRHNQQDYIKMSTILIVPKCKVWQRKKTRKIKKIQQYTSLLYFTPPVFTVLPAAVHAEFPINTERGDRQNWRYRFQGGGYNRAMCLIEK